MAESGAFLFLLSARGAVGTHGPEGRGGPVHLCFALHALCEKILAQAGRGVAVPAGGAGRLCSPILGPAVSEPEFSILIPPPMDR